MSSIGHARTGVDFDDPHFVHRPYDKWTAYGQAKSANALFAVELDRLGKAHGVRAFSLHPGGIRTPLQRHMTMEEMTAMGWYTSDGELSDMFKSVEQGAATSVWCATSPQLADKGGVYCEDCDIAWAWRADLPPYTGVPGARGRSGCSGAIMGGIGGDDRRVLHHRSGRRVSDASGARRDDLHCAAP